MASPPTALNFAPPNGSRAEAAELWLGAHGFPAYTPTIRSSDYKTCLADPFRYYLTRRLGLVQALSWSAALSRGSWLHKALELDPLTKPPDPTTYAKALADRLSELTIVCNSLGIIGESRDAILGRERLDADSAWGWYHAARDVPVQPPAYPAFPAFFSRFEVLGRELTLSLATGRIKRWLRGHGIEPFAWPNIVVQYDLLLGSSNNSFWIADCKTTAYPTADRLSSCPYEFQTQLYANFFWLAQEFYPELLPESIRDRTLKGVLHLAIQKPDIKFGQNDRPCKTITHVLKSGPRKGQTEVRRTYSGEPQLPLYIDRCREWYHGTGQYEHLAAERGASPTVNYSRTPAALTKTHEQTFVDRLRFLMLHATCAPYPRNFLVPDDGHLDRGGLSFWAPFYLSPPDEWPKIIGELGLIQKFRDEPHMEETPSRQDAP